MTKGSTWKGDTADERENSLCGNTGSDGIFEYAVPLGAWEFCPGI